MDWNREHILRLFREGTQDARAAFVLACPLHPRRDQAVALAASLDVPDRVAALGILCEHYCHGPACELGAEMALAGHALGLEAVAGFAYVPPRTLSGLAADAVEALVRLGREAEALASCEGFLRHHHDPSDANVALLEERLEELRRVAREDARIESQRLERRFEDSRLLEEESLRRAEEERSFRLGAGRPGRTRRMAEADPRPEAAAPPGEEAVVTRHPQLDVIGRVEPRAELRITVDLALAPDGRTEADPAHLGFLPGQQELPVEVRLIAPELCFEEGADEGVVVVRRTGPSRAWKTRARVAAELGGREAIVVRASFFCAGRHCGSARRAFLVDTARSPAPIERAAGDVVGVGAPSGPGHALVPEPRAISAPMRPTAGGFAADPSAPAPLLTVEMIRVEDHASTFNWHVHLPQEARTTPGLPQRLAATVKLGRSAPAFVAGLFEDVEARSSDHVALFQGVGDALYARTPACFQQAYWALTDRYGSDFPIQIVSDDPYIPWELMRPSRDGVVHDLLAVAHPVGRWFLDHEPGLRNSLARGTVVTFAPDYSGRPELKPLPAAQMEAKAVIDAVPGTRRGTAERKAFLELLVDAQKAEIALIHFSGHGKAPVRDTDRALLCLEDDDLLVREIDRSETQLGVHRHPLVFLNACEVARSGLSLGMLSGFAKALMKHQFGGLIAPLWAVYDSAAVKVTETFVCAVLQQRQAFAAALRDVRRKYGKKSPTFLSYVYYGDVMAHFA